MYGAAGADDTECFLKMSRSFPLFKWVLLGWAAIGLLGARPLTAAVEVQNPFERGNQLYEQGKYSEAVASYEQMLQQGVRSVAVYYNLGNAYFKAGQTGRAILNYRRAQSLSPRDPEVRSNLQFARAQALGGKVGTVAYWKMNPILSLNELAILSAVAGWVFFGLLALKEQRRTRVNAAVYLSCLLWLISLAALGLRYRNQVVIPQVVVHQREGLVRRGPLEESQLVFTAANGTEFRVLDRKDAWLKVEDDSNHRGWILQSETIPLIR